MKSLMMFFRAILLPGFLFKKGMNNFLRLLVLTVVFIIFITLGLFGVDDAKPTFAQVPELEVTSTIPIPTEILASVVETLGTRPGDILPGNRLIVTSLDQNSGWALMTVAAQPSNLYEDILANSTLVIARSVSGEWTSAVLGTDAYEAMLIDAPSSLLPAESKQLLSARTSPSKSGPQSIGTTLRWPWSSSSTWEMTQGPHSWYGSGKGSDLSALDFASRDGNTGVYAAAAGTIIRRCDDNIQHEVVIRHATGTGTDDVTGYLHLDKNGPYAQALPLGVLVSEGDYIGSYYNDAIPKGTKCGWGTGGHLHFWIGTISTNGSITWPTFNYDNMVGQTISGWQMQSNPYCFHKGSERPICPYTPIPGDGSTPGPRPPSNLSANPVSSSQINLSWSGSPDSIDGYRIYSGSSMIANKVSSTNYSISGLNSCSTYSFYVTAYKGDLESDGSNTASAKTSGCSSGAPSAPSLSSPGNGQVFGRYDAVNLVWNSNGS
jgi:hypothetical protein